MCWFILGLLGYAICKGLQEKLKTRKLYKDRLKRRIQHARLYYKKG